MELKSLADNCIQTIIQNFERFNFVYNSTQDVNIQRHFEFLQRCYATELLNELSEHGVVKEDYFPLVINKYLRELDLAVLSHCTWETVKELIVKIGQGLNKVTFSSWHTTFLSLALMETIISHLKNVKVLQMRASCNDDILEIIVKSCPNLIELDISESNQVTDVGIKRFCEKNDKGEVSNPLLRILNMERTNVIDKTVALVLENLPCLEVLNWPNLPTILYDMHKKDVLDKTLNKVRKYNLTKIDYMYCTDESGITDILHLCSDLCPNVNFLAFPIAKQEQLNICSQFIRLRSVTLEFLRVNGTHLDINNFLKLRGGALIFLKLSGFSVSVAQLASSCPLLETLWLRDMAFQSFDKDEIPELKYLDEFSLDGANFKDVATTISTNLILSSSPKLGDVGIVRSKFFNPELKGEILKCCDRCPLRHINFNSSDVDSPLLESILLTSTTLDSLAIENCQMLTLEDIATLTDLAVDLKNTPEIIYDNDEESEFSYGSEYDDIFDDYDYYGDPYDYEDDDDDFDPYDGEPWID